MCSPGWRACSSRRGFNIFSPGGRPDRRDERFSRITIVVDVESAPLEQIVQQLDKLINVVAISSSLPPRRSSASCFSRPSRPDPQERAQVIQLVGVFGGEDRRRRAPTG